jgi:hypothetical protein
MHFHSLMDMTAFLQLFKKAQRGATTLSLTTFGRTTLSIMTFSKETLNIVTFGLTRLSITVFKKFAIIPSIIMINFFFLVVILVKLIMVRYVGFIMLSVFIILCH